MSRFVFKLESVLSLRTRAEQRCQRALAVTQTRAAELKQRIAILNTDLATARDLLRGRLRSKILDPSWLANHSLYAQSLEAQLDRGRIELDEAQKRVADARASLQLATSQRKSLEKLRQRQEEQWRASEQKQERLAHDQAGSRVARPA